MKFNTAIFTFLILFTSSLFAQDLIPADKLQEELAGRTGSGRPGEGPTARQIRADLERIQRELADLKSKNEEEMGRWGIKGDGGGIFQQNKV